MNLCEGDKERVRGSYINWDPFLIQHWAALLSHKEVVSLVYVASFTALGLFNLALLIIHANSSNLGRSALSTGRRVYVL